MSALPTDPNTTHVCLTVCLTRGVAYHTLSLFMLQRQFSVISGTSAYSCLPYRPYPNSTRIRLTIRLTKGCLPTLFEYLVCKYYSLCLYRTRHIKAAAVHAEDISRQFSVMSGTSACSCLPYRPYSNLILTLHVSASRFASTKVAYHTEWKKSQQKTSIPFIGLSCGCVRVSSWVAVVMVLLRVAVVCCQRLQEIKIC